MLMEKKMKGELSDMFVTKLLLLFITKLVAYIYFIC